MDKAVQPLSTSIREKHLRNQAENTCKKGHEQKPNPMSVEEQINGLSKHSASTRYTKIENETGAHLWNPRYY